ncbi:MAG: DUF3310 domain-containing protein, partial [Steroidobacteraceae bacterium]
EPQPRDDGPDEVEHPAHYTSGRVEVIDLLEQAVEHAPDGVAAALQWQSLKYLNRLWLKGRPAVDARKAAWYLDRLIDHLVRGGAGGGDALSEGAADQADP